MRVKLEELAKVNSKMKRNFQLQVLRAAQEKLYSKIVGKRRK